MSFVSLNLYCIVLYCCIVGDSDAASPARQQHHLDSLMPMSSVGASLSAEADMLTLCGRWPVVVPHVFRLLLPSQSIDPNSQPLLLSLLSQRNKDGRCIESGQRSPSQLVAWLSGNALVLISVVALHWTRLVLGWVTDCGA